MTRYYGQVAYGEDKETHPGVYDKVITERSYKGDVEKISRRLQDTDKINGDITVQNTISIIADAFAMSHFYDIIYVTWLGNKWIVSSVEVDRPRLTLRLGGLYNGPTA